MDQEIELAPALLDNGEHRVHGRRFADIAGNNEVRAQRIGQRIDAFFQCIALKGKSQFGALIVDGLGDAPGD